MKKKSNEEKALLGTGRSDREGAALSSYDGEIPKPFFKLSAAAKRWYNDICQELISVDAFQKSDAILVCQFCKSLDLYIKVGKEINNADDCVQTFGNGTTNITGKFSAFTKLHTQLKDLYDKLCIGVKSRSNVPQYITNQLQLNFNGAPDPFVVGGKALTI